MDLNKDVISKIVEVFDVSAEDITAGLTGEKDLELKLKGQLFTEDEINSRDSYKYNEGKEAGVEMLVKNAKKQFGYDFDGKSWDEFINHHDSALKKKYSKGVDERVSGLEKDLDKQRQAFEAEILQLKTVNSDLETRYKKQDNKNFLLSIMPKETVLKPEAIITLFNSEHQLDVEDGKRVVKKGGEILKNPKTTSPLDPSEVFNEWILNEKYTKKDTGRGLGNEFGERDFAGIKTPEDFERNWLKKNPDSEPTSPEYREAYLAWRVAQKKTA